MLTVSLHLADWIAHGLMDSIVDSFFPLIDYVEFEADDIDGKIVHHDELGPYSRLAALLVTAHRRT